MRLKVQQSVESQVLTTATGNQTHYTKAKQSNRRRLHESIVLNWFARASINGVCEAPPAILQRPNQKQVLELLCTGLCTAQDANEW